MKKSDLFQMALSNLRNRKTRTWLTVIGVIIGTCAIVIMVSIGVGIDKMVTAQYSSDNSLNKITVYSGYGEDGGEEVALDDNAVSYLQGLEHVNLVVPIVNVNGYTSISRGKYSLQYAEIKGIDFDIMQQIGFELTEGSFNYADKASTVYFGKEVVINFADAQGNPVKYKYDDNYEVTDCEIDPMKDIFMMGTPVYNQNEGTSTVTNEKRIKVGGIVKNDYKVDYSSGTVYVDIETAKQLVRDYNKLNPTGEKATLQYSDVWVYVDEMENVKDVQNKINKTGLGCISDEEGLEYTKKIMKVVQLILGAIGAVSMLVAAFGISNTMVMSVYERTKEIGIMKVIGCDIKDIKAMFLYEAGIIGLTGGTIGIIISIIISAVANAVARAVISSMSQMEDGMQIYVSSVPPWLVLLGIGFAVLVGVVAGIAPANRSVKVSALTAIHNE